MKVSRRYNQNLLRKNHNFDVKFRYQTLNNKFMAKKLSNFLKIVSTVKSFSQDLFIRSQLRNLLKKKLLRCHLSNTMSLQLSQNRKQRKSTQIIIYACNAGDLSVYFNKDSMNVEVINVHFQVQLKMKNHFYRLQDLLIELPFMEQFKDFLNIPHYCM